MADAKDTLRSRAFVNLLDLLSEGEVEGLVAGAQSIILDGTRLGNSDGTRNFQNVTWVERRGTLAQSSIPGFSAQQNAVSVGVEVTAAAPVVRTITNPEVSAAVVVIGIPALSSTNTANGDVSGTSVQFKIEVQPNGGSWQSATLGTEVLPLKTVSASQVTTDTYAASACTLTVSFWGVATSDTDGPIAVSYSLQYRVQGAAAWTTARTGTLNAETGQTDSYSERFTLTPAKYEWRVVRTGGASFAPSLSGTMEVASATSQISGKSSSRYQRSYRIELPVGGAPWNLRITRTTPDSTSQYLQNKTYWDTYSEVVDAKLRLPGSALVALSLDAESFPSIPTRGYDIKLLRVKVPSNYDPIARTYSGSWDGTFVTAWSNNPAWVWYDLATNTRYGLGEYIDTASVDKWALYTIGRYCDELVPSGLGGLEPRFTCNVWLSSRTEAYKLMQDLAAVFRGMVFWSSGIITAVQDSPASAAYLYTPANVIDGTFTYAGSSRRQRHTVALVTWNDMNDLGRQKVEYVEDRDGIAKYGVIETQVAAIGCTSRGQAARAGRWLLFTERLETETVTFRAGMDGAVARPGQIIKIADPARAGVRFGGRFVSATTTTAVLDAAVTLVAGQTYTLSALKADGTVMEATVTSAAGTLSSITFSALPEAPSARSVWVLASATVDVQLFRVLGVVENDRHEFEVLALEHSPGKFASVEQGLTLQPRSISVLSPIPPAPTGVNVSETLYLQGTSFLSRLDASWQPVAGAQNYVVQMRRGDGNFGPEMVTRTASIEIAGLIEGAYTLRIYSASPTGDRSRVPSDTVCAVSGKTLPPANVQGLVVTRYLQTLTFQWRPNTDVDLAYYELRQGNTWATATVVATTAGTRLDVISPRGGTFQVRAVDTSGNYSADSSVVVAADVSGINVVLSIDDGTGGFGGLKVGTAEVPLFKLGTWDSLSTWDDMGTWDAPASLNGITLAGPLTWSALTQPWSAYSAPWLFSDVVRSSPYTTWSAMTGTWSSYVATWETAASISGTYQTDVVDIGYVATSVVSIAPRMQVLQRAAKAWALYTLPWSAYAGPEWTWQGYVADVSAGYEVSTSLDGTTWSTWLPFGVGSYRFRYIRFRVTLATANSDTRPYLTSFVVYVDVPDRVDHLENVSIPIGGATITFSPAFVGIETVQVTLQSATSGDRFTVTGKTSSSVTIQVFDQAGAPKAGLVDVDAFGYGERY